MAVAREIVIPSAMKRVGGVTAAIEGLLLVKVTYTPPAGAGVPKATGKVAELPDVTARLDDSTIPPAADCMIDTLAFALPTLAPLALIVTAPGATPVTGTDTLVESAAKVTAAGTIATEGLLEVMLTVSAAAGGADRLSMRFWVVFWFIVKLPGQKLIVAPEPVPEVTCT